MNWMRQALVVLAGGLLGLAVLRLMLRPRRLVRWLAARAPQVMFFKETPEPVIALTLDDGPHRTGSPLILEVLARYRVPATFFIISSQIPGREALLRQMVAQGHELGNHGTHNFPAILLLAGMFERDLRAAHTALAPFTPRVRWYRPGHAWTTPALLASLERHGYRCALGSVWPYDSLLPVPPFSANFVLANVRPGSVIILHDGPTGALTAKALSSIIPALLQRGYQFVTLSELAGEKT